MSTVQVSIPCRAQYGGLRVSSFRVVEEDKMADDEKHRRSISPKSFVIGLDFQISVLSFSVVISSPSSFSFRSVL